VKPAFVPCGTGKTVLLVRVTVGVVRLTELQLFTKLVTFTEPSPVAKSYPVVLLNAGVAPPVAVAMMPNCPEFVLLQFGLPPAHATELLPLVTS